MESHNAGSYSIGLTKVRSNLQGNTTEGREASLDAVESTQEQVAENGLASQTTDINSMEMREDSGQRMRRILQETAANFYTVKFLKLMSRIILAYRMSNLPFNKLIPVRKMTILEYYQIILEVFRTMILKM